MDLYKLAGFDQTSNFNLDEEPDSDPKCSKRLNPDPKNNSGSGYKTLKIHKFLSYCRSYLT